MELMLAVIALAVIVPVGFATLVLRLSAKVIGLAFGVGCSVALLLLVLVRCLSLG